MQPRWRAIKSAANRPPPNAMPSPSQRIRNNLDAAMLAHSAATGHQHISGESRIRLGGFIGLDIVDRVFYLGDGFGFVVGDFEVEFLLQRHH